MIQSLSSQLQPLQARTETPAEPRRIVVLKINLPAVPDDVEAEGTVAVTHGDTGHRHNRNGMPLADDPCCGWDLGPLRDYFRRKLVQEVGVCKEGRGALVCLSVA